MNYDILAMNGEDSDYTDDKIVEYNLSKILIEPLYAEFLLWFVGLTDAETYESLLHEKFMLMNESDILLGLEELTGDPEATKERFSRYWAFESSAFQADGFGRQLVAGLKVVYASGRFGMEAFGKRCYELWSHIPDKLQRIEPFHVLSYADDCLSFDDEPQMRAFYEEMFAFYDNK